MKVHKVVEKQTRWCSNWALFKSEDRPEELKKEILRFRKTYPQYFPRYFKGRTIVAAAGTPGILTFNEVGAADLFVLDWPDAKLIIIEVEGHGEPRRHPFLNGNCGGNPTNVKGTEFRMPAPFGSLAFDSVTVLT